MGGLPTSKEGLEAAGYLFDNESHCRACGAPIEWYISPRNKKIPFDVVAVKGTDTFFSPVREFQRIPHWASCPNAADFRKKRVQDEKTARK